MSLKLQLLHSLCDFFPRSCRVSVNNTDKNSIAKFLCSNGDIWVAGMKQCLPDTTVRQLILYRYIYPAGVLSSILDITVTKKKNVISMLFPISRNPLKQKSFNNCMSEKLEFHWSIRCSQLKINKNCLMK